ncbi:MAG: hypothetical protein PHU59_01890 [Candidatus Omnitrophica bacterium]|nr:hypothetical protein [Candidatus Omnitrophota bacterium]
MENAIFITKISQLKYVTSKFSRLYYGNEFCERLIPSLKDLNQILRYTKRMGLDFSLATPYVTDSGLKKLKILFKFLKTKKIKCEVIVNDWGVLNLINRKYPNLQPVLGRLLTKQKRGPQLIKLLKRQVKPKLIINPDNPAQRNILIQKKLPLDLDYYYKGSNSASVPIIHNFLISQRIKKIELDNLGQGILLNLPRGKISASVYTPYIYITTTFFCPTAGCDQKKKSWLKIKPCRKQCQRYIFKLRNLTMPKVIYLKGNTQFYKNNKLSLKELINLGVNRIVYQPEIPV